MHTVLASSLSNMKFILGHVCTEIVLGVKCGGTYAFSHRCTTKGYTFWAPNKLKLLRQQLI